MGRPSIDPELMIRMLVVGYVFAIRSERLICREVQVNLAYRWFCKLGIEDAIPDHSAFSRARNERFREGDVFRRVFERVVEACIVAGLVPTHCRKHRRDTRGCCADEYRSCGRGLASQPGNTGAPAPPLTRTTPSRLLLGSGRRVRAVIRWRRCAARVRLCK